MVLEPPEHSGPRPGTPAVGLVGLRTVLLTGDAGGIARMVGAQLGVDEVAAELLPDEKLARVRTLVREGKTVGMVGDGIRLKSDLSGIIDARTAPSPHPTFSRSSPHPLPLDAAFGCSMHPRMCGARFSGRRHIVAAAIRDERPVRRRPARSCR